MSDGQEVAGHAFLSYVREDSQAVDMLQRVLEAAGIRIWRDTADLWPGEDWRSRIRRAITDNALALIACFSQSSVSRERSYQNEELVLAIEQLRLRRQDDSWLIPVRFDDCVIPDWEIGGGGGRWHRFSEPIFLAIATARASRGSSRLCYASLASTLTSLPPRRQRQPRRLPAPCRLRAGGRASGNYDKPGQLGLGTCDAYRGT